MNGKIKTKFAALFAVALMITVCVVPVVGNEDVQAADVSSTIPEGISDIEIQFFTEDSTDFSDMVYCDNSVGVLPETVDPVEWKEVGDTGCYININEKSEYFGKFLRYGQTGLTNEQILSQAKVGKWLPMIQTSYMYTEAVDILISVDAPGTGHDVSDTGSKSFVKGGATFDEVECVSTIKFIGTSDEYSKCMEFSETLAEATGEYDVKITSQGVPVADKKFTFQSETDMEKITGTVKDASSTAKTIEGAKIAYKINGVDGYVESDEIGKYEIVFVPGSVVSITSVTYPNDAYTFKNTEDAFNYSYDFGTIDTGKTFNISAVEQTGTAKAISKNNTTIPEISMEFQWYYQYKTTQSEDKFVISDSAPSGITAGTVSVLGVKEGIVSFTYSEPTGTASGVTNYGAFLLNKSVSADGFTFNKATIGYESEESITEIIDNKDGTKEFSEASTSIVAVKANENLNEIDVLSNKSDFNIYNATIELTWYYEYKEENATSYTVVSNAPTGVTAGTVAILGEKEDGSILYSWSAPVFPASGYSDYNAYLINTSVSAPGFTFETSSIESGKTSKLESQITKAGTDVFVKYENSQFSAVSGAELVSKEVAYKVTGKVTGIPVNDEGEYPEVTVNYTNGVGTSTKAIWNGSNGIYSFYVLAGNSSTITPVFDGYKFDKTSYTLPTASGSTYSVTGPNFAAESTAESVELLLVSSKTSSELGFTGAENGEVAKITYTVGDKEYVTPIAINSQKIQVSVNVFNAGNVVTIIGAEADGYFAYVGENGAFGTHATEVYKYFVYDEDVKVPVPDFEFDLYRGNGDYITTVKTDSKGMIEVELDVVPAWGLYGGLYKVPFDSTSKVVGYASIDVKDFVNITPVNVKIQYVSAFNVDGDYIGGVGNGPIVNGNAIAEPIIYKATSGSSVALKAPSIDNFEFVAWMVDGVVVSESADYTLKVDGNCNVVALYSAVHYEEPAEGLSMNVLVIGIVILILGVLAVAYGIISKKQ